MTNMYRKIECRIMDKYRNNPELAEELINKVRLRNGGRDLSPRPHRQPVVVHEQAPLRDLFPERLNQAADRRSHMLEDQLEQLQERKQKWLEQIKRQQQDHQIKVTHNHRMRMTIWLTCVAALSKLHKMHVVVKNVREVRMQDLKK